MSVESAICVEGSPARLPRRVLLIALASEALLVLLDLLLGRTSVLGFPPLARVFDITSEGSLGNFFSAVQALAVAVVLWLIRCRVKREKAARWQRWGWAVLALSFLYLGVDDGVMLHERIGSYATHLGGASFHRIETGFGSYTWQLVLGPPFAIMGLFMLVFLWRELDRQGLLLVVLAFACYAVAVGLDYLEGRPGSLTPLVPLLHLDIGWVRHGVQVLEELLEMLGTTLFLLSFLSRLLAPSSGKPANFAASGDEFRRPEA